MTSIPPPTWSMSRPPWCRSPTRRPHDPEELNQICQAGHFIHDIGKMYVPAPHPQQESEPLTPAEWTMIRQHPQTSAEHLEKAGVSPARLDRALPASRTRDGLRVSAWPPRRQEIDTISRICASVEYVRRNDRLPPIQAGHDEAAEAVATSSPKLPPVTTRSSKRGSASAGCPSQRGLRDPSSWRTETDRDPPTHLVSIPHPLPRTDLSRQRSHRSKQPQDPHSIEVTVHSLSQVGVAFLSPSPIFAGQHVRHPVWPAKAH